MDGAAQHAVDVRIQYRDMLAERKRGYGRGGIRADAGKLSQSIGGARQFAAVALHDLPREPVQADGAAVVPHPGPEADDIGGLGVGERAECGEGVEEGAVLGDDALHLGLLEHDLRDEDGVRVGDAAPGEDAGVARVPGGNGVVEGAGVDHHATRLRAGRRGCCASPRQRRAR